MIMLAKLAMATMLAGALAGVAATEASAAPVNGRAIATASPSLTTEVQYVYWGNPRYSYWGYPGYRTYWYPSYGYVY